MRREEKKRVILNRNSFGQTTTSIETQVYYYGTLGEALELSQDEPVTLKRDDETEKFFRAWDDDSKYVTIRNGEATCFSDKIEPLETVFVIEKT